jgi:biotin transport system substrate-specific component
MKDSSVRSTVLVAAFTALIIVGAIFSFPSPWNPVVPFTMATLFVILSGMMLGPMRGLAAAGLYLFLGIIGLPVFAGGSGGIQVLAGPTGGFLAGYLLAAFLGGVISRAGKNRLGLLIAAALAASVAIYIPGLPWMHYRLTGMVEGWSWASTWGKYTLPFLVGDLIKAIAAVVVARFLKDRVV